MGAIGEGIKMWWMSDEKEKVYRKKGSKEFNGCIMNAVMILVSVTYVVSVGEVDSLYEYPGELVYVPLVLLTLYFVYKKIENKREIKRLERKMKSM